MRNDGAQSSTSNYSGVGHPTYVPQGDTARVEKKEMPAPIVMTGTTETVTKHAGGGNNLDITDRELTTGNSASPEIPIIDKTTADYSDRLSFDSGDSIKIGTSLPNAVNAFKCDFLRQRDGQRTAETQNNLKSCKEALEAEGWSFVKNLDQNCPYIGYNLATGQFGFGLDSSGSLIEFGQNNSFAHPV